MIIEIRTLTGWEKAGEVTLLGSENEGLNAACRLEYLMDYAIDKIDKQQDRGDYALSCHYGVDLSLKTLSKWPSFLLDLFPQGAALKYVVDHYRIADQPQNYWNILNTAVLNPPGNIRINCLRDEDDTNHPGFEKAEVIEKGHKFVEYMVQCGAPSSGTTGAAGAAPKFLLREDYNGRFYADGVLPDKLTKTCWLVKFPRGDFFASINKEILKAEKSWHDIAKQTGLNTYGCLEWYPDCLFIPRFDREVSSDGVGYLGLESFYSLVDSSEFGSRFDHKTYLNVLHLFSDEKEKDAIEYLLRDILNQIMGNTDNHGRNQSVFKKGNLVYLSPIYDFAPMKFDPEGIPRNTRWKDEDNFLNEAVSLLVNNYHISEATIKKSIEIFWQNFLSIDLSSFDFLEKFKNDLDKEKARMNVKIEKYLGGKK